MGGAQVLAEPDPDAPEGTIQLVSHDGAAYAIVHHASGWSAVPDRCPHSGCAFSKFGELVEGTILVCNCHGSEFDVVTGEVLAGPAQNALEVTNVPWSEGALELSAIYVRGDEGSRDNAVLPSSSRQLLSDLSLCKGYANCVVAADDYLDLDDDGLVVLLQTDVPDADRPRIEEAVRSCPVSALRLSSDV